MKKILYTIVLTISFAITGCHTNEIDFGTAGMLPQSNAFHAPDKNEAVDLGLSVNWAPYNVGASKSSEYGNFYAYGETEFKTEYSSSTYAGIPDIEKISHTQYDVATAKWGGNWRIPTAEEVAELENLCSWDEGIIDGVPGMIITGPSGNSIFLPASGYCINKIFEDTDVYGHYMYELNDSYGVYNHYFNLTEVFYGMSVRPVLDKGYYKANTIIDVINNYEDDKKYSVTGKVSHIVDSLSMIFYIQDNTAEILVNGLSSADISTKSGSDSSVVDAFDLKVGDIVTVVGKITEIGGVVQMAESYCEEVNEYPEMSNIKLVSVEENVKSMYNKDNEQVRFSFKVSALSENKHLVYWGYHLYKNDEIYQTFKTEQSGLFINDIEFSISKDDFDIDYDNYSAVSKDKWSIGLFACTSSGDLDELAGVFRTDLNTNYNRKPKVFFSDLYQGEDEDPNPDRVQIKLQYIGHIDGALFIDEISYYSNDSDTGINNTASDNNYTPGKPEYTGAHYFSFGVGHVDTVYTWYLIESHGRKFPMDNCVLVTYNEDGSMTSTITDYPYDYNPDIIQPEEDNDEGNNEDGNDGSNGGNGGDTGDGDTNKDEDNNDGGGGIVIPPDSTNRTPLNAVLCSFTEVEPKMFKTYDSSVHHKYNVKVAITGDHVTECGYKVYKDGVLCMTFKSGYADTVSHPEYMFNIAKQDYNIDYSTYTAVPKFNLTVSAYCKSETEYYETPENERYKIDLTYNSKPKVYFTNLKHDILSDSNNEVYVSMRYICNIKGGLFIDEISYYNNDDDTEHNNDMSDNNYDINNPPYSGTHSFSYTKGTVMEFYTWYLIRCNNISFPMDNCVYVRTDSNGKVYTSITDGPYKFIDNSHQGGSGDAE